jgi:hypothetical protein
LGGNYAARLGGTLGAAGLSGAVPPATPDVRGPVLVSRGSPRVGGDYRARRRFSPIALESSPWDATGIAAAGKRFGASAGRSPSHALPASSAWPSRR